MENILNLKTYSKYKSLFDDGLILVPDDTLSTAINDVLGAYRAKPFMKDDEVHEVTLKAGKKVRITSRGSLRDIEIDGITFDSIEQAACNIYDPYIDIKNIGYETEFEFSLTIDFNKINDLEYYNVTKDENIDLDENYILKEDAIINISYANISDEYKNEIKNDNFQIEFLGKTWIIND